MNLKSLVASTVLLGFAVSALAQGSITIKSSAKNDSIYYICYTIQELIDRENQSADKQYVITKKGKATINVPKGGAIYEFWGPGLLNNYTRQVFALPGDKIRITVTGPERKDMTITGTALVENVARIEAEGDSLQNILRTLPKENRAEFDRVYTQWRERYDKALPSHLNDYFGIYCMGKATLTAMDKHYDNLKVPVENSFMAPLYEKNKVTIENYREKKAAKERIKVGAVAPDFTLPDMEGKLVSLSSFKGKWVLLDFWGSWCKWCMVGVPQMKENYAKFSDKCEFVGIDCNEGKSAWIKSVKENDMRWVQLYNEPANGKPASVIYGVSGYPTKILIDPEGRIAKICIGEDKTFYDDFPELMK